MPIAKIEANYEIYILLLLKYKNMYTLNLILVTLNTIQDNFSIIFKSFSYKNGLTNSEFCIYFKLFDILFTLYRVEQIYNKEYWRINSLCQHHINNNYYNPIFGKLLEPKSL